MDLGLWVVGVLHSTATMSSEGVRGLYGLRLMHRLNIFPSCLGHSGWAGSFFFFMPVCRPNPNLSEPCSLVTSLIRNYKSLLLDVLPPIQILLV
jgi:hypothetical protein